MVAVVTTASPAASFGFAQPSTLNKTTATPPPDSCKSSVPVTPDHRLLGAVGNPYLAISPLMEDAVVTNNCALRMSITKSSSFLNRRTRITFAPIWQSVSGNVFVPKTPELFYYDPDGNLTNDGRWTYTWDAENRLVNMTSASSAPRPGSKLKLDFVYDWQGRRIQKLVSTNNGSIYVAQYTNRFVYDGWNLLAVIDPNAAMIRSFIWGFDLSGSLQGAGGVGGLLALNDTANGVHFCAYDGNGNLAALVKASDGTVSGNWEYGPFGEVVRQSGLMAKANPFRFSTKYQDDENDNLYYGYRSYNPTSGRWLSRDPIEERGGVNFYGFLRNSPLYDVDAFGMCGEDGPGGGDNPVCGQEVAGPLNKVLDQVMTYFNSSWNRKQKDDVCSRLVGVGPAGGENTAWDIIELRDKGDSDLEGCSRQVTFEGRCYFGGAVNYALFGKALKKCHEAFPYYYRYTHSAMMAGIIFHKRRTKGGFDHPEAQQALVFANYGWRYSGASPTGGKSLWPQFTCAPDMRSDTREYHWMLRPHKPL